jgi:adenylate kinase
MQLVLCLTLAFFRHSLYRNYSLAKIQDNNEAEIMEVVLAEARDAYPAEAIVVLKSETNEEVESNVARIITWIQAWRAARGFPSDS